MDIKLISTLLLIHFMALISPGPDLVLTLRNAINRGMRAGILSSLGFAFGIFFHSLIAVLIIKGLGILPKTLMPLLGLPGALYLIYLGIKAWPQHPLLKNFELAQSADKSSPFLQGLITNLLNPKASLFTIGLITTQVRPDTANSTIITLIFSMMLLTMMWFSFVSLCLSHEKIRTLYFKQSRNFDYLFSVLFIFFGGLLLKDLLGLFLSNLS